MKTWEKSAPGRQPRSSNLRTLDYRFYQTALVSTVPGTDKSMRVTALNPPFTCKPPNAQVPLDKGRKQAMQILNGRAGLGPMSEAKAHALLLRAAHSLCAASAWLAQTPAASRINGGGGPRGHSPPSPPCSCSCWCSRASATCYSPPRDQSGRECGLHHSWAPIRFSELAPRFAREGGVQRSPSHAGLACGSL